MKELRFYSKDPRKAYLNNNLLLPKRKIHVDRVKSALTFMHGEVIEMDPISGVPLCAVPGSLKLWDETAHHLIVPREFLTAEQRTQFDFEFVDEKKHFVFEHVDFGSNIVPRNESQERALAIMAQHHSGTLNLACGKGKTVLALAHAAKLAVPTIVVVNTTALLEQWIEEIHRHLNVNSVGVVQGTKLDWKGHPIVVAMVHTLSLRRNDWPREFRTRFGLVIYDECFPANTSINGTPIQKIQPGDTILSYSEKDKSTLPKKVVQVFKNRVSALIKIQAGGRTVVCTPNHPFLTTSGWVRAQDLTKASMVLGTVDGICWLRVESVEVLEPGSDGTFGGLCSDGFVYNLEVEDTHTYLANGFVVHNCHHMSAPIFVRSADLFYGARCSLSATPIRTDGLERMYQAHLGPVIHSNLEQDLIPSTTFHVIEWVLTDREVEHIVDSSNIVNPGKLRTYLGSLQWRNDLIVSDLQFDLASGRQILVLSHSVEHVNLLFNYFAPAGGGLITGATPQDERMAVLRECNPVFGTFQLAREGLNKPSLDTLYLTTPFSNRNDLQQTLGRIQRKFADKKESIVRIYEDKAINWCVVACRKLRRILSQWGYPSKRRRVCPEEF